MKTENVIFFLAAILFFGFFDAISTLLCFNHLGTSSYESSGLLKYAFEFAGIGGFLLVKCGLSTLCFLAAFFAAERFSNCRYMGLSVLAGAAVTGLFVSLSNLNVVFNGHSFWIMGLDSGVVSMLIIFTSITIGICLDVYTGTRKTKLSIA